MKVIVAGMPKTGTKSMCAALNLLGYKTYDWLENFWYLGDDWVRIMTEGGTADDFRRMYAGVDAVTDTPCFFYWEELLEAFPDAKVILTVRDEEPWCRSRAKQSRSLNSSWFLKFVNCFTYTGLRSYRYRIHTFAIANHMSRLPWRCGNLMSNAMMIAQYRKHNENVKKNCPPDQLLVYEVSQGWGPLCRFLGVETPPGEFPYKNRGCSVVQDMRRENPIMRRVQMEACASLACIFALSAFGLYQLLLKNATFLPGLAAYVKSRFAQLQLLIQHITVAHSS